MPSVRIVKESPIVRSARVMQMEGMFDVPPDPVSRVEWNASLPFEDDPWNIGLIVGPSGCGKSTIARELFATELVDSFDWPRDRCILDAFPAAMGIKDVTGLLSSVGFSSPPNWLRPFHVLSNGEQFRVTIARALAEQPELVVIDEFTSVVDRTVAKIGSAAVAKAVRRRGQKFVAVACHFDIIEWLDPDWVYDPAADSFHWRRERRRPPIDVTIRRVDSSAWSIFKPYHYLSGNHHKGAYSFIGFVEDQPAAFCSVLHYPSKTGGFWKEHRTVVRPDFQGVGLGNLLSEYCASLFAATSKSYCDTTSHPGHVHHRYRSPFWKVTRKASFVAKPGAKAKATASHQRLTYSFRYCGPARAMDARRFGIPGVKGNPDA